MKCGAGSWWLKGVNFEPHPPPTVFFTLPYVTPEGHIGSGVKGPLS